MEASESNYNSTNKNLLLVVAMMASFITPFMGASVNLALPQISSEFDLNASEMSWIAMAYILASAVFLVPFGKLSDIIGRKKIFVSGMLIITAGSLLCAISVSGIILIISRVLQGLGSAMVFGTSMAIVTSAFPAQKRGRAIGLIVASVYVGLSAAPVLGGFLTHYIGWRSIFFITMCLCLFVAIVAFLAIKETWNINKPEKFDLRGSILYIISMSILMYGLSKLTEPYAVALTIAGIIGMVLFIMLELRTPSPVINIGLFRHNRVFALSNMAALINYAATFAVSFILSLYLQYVKGLNPGEAGIIMIAQPLTMAIVAPIAGRLSDKYQARILSSLGMAFSVIGLIPFAFITVNTGYPFIIASLLILGLGFGIFSSPNTNSVMSSIEKKHFGFASATLGTMRLTGQMLSMAIASLSIHIFIGATKIGKTNIPEFMQSFKIVFIIFSLFCFIGIFASLARGKEIGK